MRDAARYGAPVNPYLALPRRRTRLAWWWTTMGWLVIAAVWLVTWVVSTGTALKDYRESGDPFGLWLAAIGLAALLTTLIGYTTGRSWLATVHRGRLEEARPDATVFLTARGTELAAKLWSIGFRTGGLPRTMAVTVDDEGVGLWSRRVQNGPLVMLRRDHLIGLTATMCRVGDDRHGLGGPALGVVARVSGTDGEPDGSLMLPIQIRRRSSFAVADADYAWGILKSASRVLPVMASPLS